MINLHQSSSNKLISWKMCKKYSGDMKCKTSGYLCEMSWFECAPSAQITLCCCSKGDF